MVSPSSGQDTSYAGPRHEVGPRHEHILPSASLGGPTNGVHKRPPRRNPAPRGLGHAAAYSGPPSNGAVAPAGQWPMRWLIESIYCAKVLGSAGNRLRSMRELCREPGVTARISQQLPDVDFRVFTCTGSALSVSKIAGLVVKAIFDEPETERSDETSRLYDLKLLVPQQLVPAMVGGLDRETNLRDIEGRSNAQLSCERSPLPGSDELVLHIFGVADAVQIALYYTAETLRKVVHLSKTTSSMAQLPYEPVSGTKLRFPKGHTSEYGSRYAENSDRRSPNKAEDGRNSDSHNEDGRSSDGRESDGRNSEYRSGNSGPYSGFSTGPYSSSQAGSTAHTPDSIKLPSLQEDSSLPNTIFMAYEIARTSRSKQLRQIVRINELMRGSPEQFEELLSNIKRVTECRAELDQGLGDDQFATYPSDEDPDSANTQSLVLNGAPEENMLALFLIYRFVKRQVSLSKSEQTH